MRPQLIVDLRERSFAAVVLGEEGRVLPCSQQVAGVARRWFAGEVLLSAPASPASNTERAGLDHELAVEDLALARPRNLFARLRPLGVLRPWDLAPGAEAVPLRHPLRVLSSPGALEEGGRTLRVACAALLDALLDPLFQFLDGQGLDLAALTGWAIVPAWTSGPAWRVLRQLFRRRGIRGLHCLPRQIAAAMLLGEEALAGSLVVDAGGDDLQLHRVELAGTGPRRMYRTASSRTVRGLGWSFWVRRLTAALAGSRRLEGGAGGALAGFDRALAGLAGGPYPTEVPAGPRLGLALLDELLAGGGEESLGERLAAELAGSLRGPVRELGAEGCLVVALGAVSALGPLERLLVRATGGQAAAQASPVPALERCARGAAGALSWLAGDPERRIEIGGAEGLRLDTLDGGSRELLPATALPRRPGERCRIRRLFTLQGDAGAAESLAASLLWGCDPDPDAGASAGVMTLDPGLGDPSAPRSLEIEVTLDLAPGGRRLAGTARAAIGGSSAIRRFRLADLPPAMHAGHLEATPAAGAPGRTLEPASRRLENNP